MSKDTRPALTQQTIKALSHALNALQMMEPAYQDQVEAGVRPPEELQYLRTSIAYFSRLIAWKERRKKGRGKGRGQQGREPGDQDMPLEGDPFEPDQGTFNRKG
jgi:hypothetical protein